MYGLMNSMCLNMGLFGGIFMLAFWGTLIALAIWFARELLNRRDRAIEASGLDILRRRYASGEIGREAFEQRRRDLLG